MLFVYLILLGRVGLPVAHDYPDRLALRDTGTLIPFLLKTDNPIMNFAVLTMNHLEGPLQFMLLNFYSFGVGDTFPLNPSTMQFSNTILVFCGCVVIFLLGKRLFGDRCGYAFVLAFLVPPWMAVTIRLPWYYFHLSSLLHLITAYFFARTMVDPQERLFRVLAPLFLALDFANGLDWPSFGLFLVLFLWLSGKLKKTISNPYMIFPVLAGGVLLLWTWLLWTKHGAAGLESSRLLYPFVRVSLETSWVSLERIWENSLLPWGPPILLAVGGVIYYFLRERKRLGANPVARPFLDATCLWLGWAGITVIWSSGSPQYLYVIGVPAAVLSGLALSKLPIKYLAVSVSILALFQVGLISNWQFYPKEDEKRRVLAAADFLIEQRPNLLARNKTLLAIDGNKDGMGGTAGAVVQYARPQNKPIIIPIDFPVTRRRGPGPTGQKEWIEVWDSYAEGGVVKADAIVMESSAIAENNPARSHWLPMLTDPHIRWLARFSEPSGEIYVGERVESGGTPLEVSPRMDVASLSATYERKYDRLSFLKENVEHVSLAFASRLSW